MEDIELDISNRRVTDDEEETEALTAAEVLQKLEDVSTPRRVVGRSTTRPTDSSAEDNYAQAELSRDNSAPF